MRSALITLTTVEGGSGSVLLVEDNEAKRRVARQLEALGHCVLKADHAAAALEIRASERLVQQYCDPRWAAWLRVGTYRDLAPGTAEGAAALGFPETKIQGHGETIAGVSLWSRAYRCEDRARALRESLDALSPAKRATAAPITRKAFKV